jgi:hypothetical protein
MCDLPDKFMASCHEIQEVVLLYEVSTSLSSTFIVLFYF